MEKDKKTKKSAQTEGKTKKAADFVNKEKTEQTQAYLPAPENKPSNISASIGPATSAASKAEDKGDRANMILGIVAVIVIFALFALALSAIARGNRQVLGTLQGETVTRLGENGTLTYELGDDVEIADGATVSWFVNGEKINETVYHKGDKIALDYQPKNVGRERVRVDIGKKYTQYADITVNKPVVTFTVPDYTVVYGDPLPEFCYECEGFINEDTKDVLHYDGRVALNADKLDVGVYELNLDRECECDNYDAEFCHGTLTVLPREVRITDSLCKVYDGTNVLDNVLLNLDNILEGDEVTASYDKLYFENKNVGRDKSISPYNIVLEGKDSLNYVVSSESIKGEIVPKKLEVKDFSIKSKMYDGTDKAEADKIGTLAGVCDGDSVAIGGFQAHFEDASAGKAKKVTVNNISLVGSDKQNYYVESEVELEGDINSDFWDNILNKPDIVQGNK